MDLGVFYPQWSGFELHNETLRTVNGERYSAIELQSLRAQMNNWRRLANVLQREITTARLEGAIVFNHKEILLIRRALFLIDEKLPGYRLNRDVG